VPQPEERRERLKMTVGSGRSVDGRRSITGVPRPRGLGPGAEPADEVVYDSSRTRVLRRWIGAVGSPVTVIVKEALGPGSGTRLDHERAILTRLAEVDGVPHLAGSLDTTARDTIVEDDAGQVSLADRISPEGWATADVLELAIQLAGTIATMHHAGVVHRDINPTNILLTPSPEGDHEIPILIDFDLATTFAEHRPEFTPTRNIVGTLPYLAPEQTGRTGRGVDHRSDLYSLGATLYEVACGHPPFGFGDPLTVIHGHLARDAAPLCQENPTVTAVLSDIVARLLAKEPDQRYQSADSLVHDLCRLRADLAAGRFEPFPLGEQDFPIRLSAPSTLVGRAAERAALARALDQVVAGHGRGVLIDGAPGVGKTALVDELRQLVTTAGGWYVAGKSDQYRQGQSTDAVTQALRALGRLLLAEPEAQLAAYRARILDSLGANAGLIATIPDLAVLLEVPGEVPDADPVELQARLVRARADLLRAVASPQRPVVMVVDDLQWAVQTDLDLLHTALSEEIPGLLLVGAFRPEEIDATHPLTALLSRWAQLEPPPIRLRLENLSGDDLSVLLATMLRLPSPRAAELAAEIGPRTSGNPFDTVELVNALRRDGVLRLGDDGWTWDPDRIRRHVDASDVLRLLSARIGRLSATAQDLLATAACLGSEVRIGLLAAAAGLSVTSAHQDLGPALEDGLLAYLHGAEDAVRFRHDRVHQAAYGLLEDAETRRERHLTIGRRLAAQEDLAGPAAEQYLRAVADGSAAAVVRETDERRGVLTLFHRAGVSVRLTNAALAERFLAAAMDLAAALELDAATDPALAALQVDRHAVLYHLGRLEEADTLYATIEGRCSDPLDLVDAACVQVAGLTNRARSADAVALGVDLLGRLGMTPPDDLMAWIGTQLDGVTAWVRSCRPEDALLPLDDPHLLAVARLVHRMLAAAFLCDPSHHLWLLLTNQRIWAEHGPSNALIASAGSTPALLIALREDYRTAYDLAQLALLTGERHGYEPATSSVRFLTASCVGHWCEPLENQITELRVARDGLIRGGDVQYAAMTYTALVAALLEYGPTLDAFEAELDAALAMAARIGSQYVEGIQLAHRQLLRALRGQTSGPGSFTDDSFDEDAHLSSDAVTPMARAVFEVARALAAALFEDDPALTTHTAAAMEQLAFVPGFYVTALARLLQALALTRRLRSTPEEDRAHLLSQLDALRDWLAARASDAPDNLAHLVALVDAERAWACGEQWSAAQAFDTALLHASARHRPWHQAFIAERTGTFLIEQGLQHTGQGVLATAHAAYAAWGATAKVDQLERAHPFLRAAARHGRQITTSRPTTSNSVNAAAVDLLGVLEASQALGQETNLDRLRGRITEVLGGLTGATSTKVLLRTDDAGTWTLLGAPTDGPAALPLTESGAARLVPLSAVRYAERTQEPLLVPDATQDDRFARDTYLTGVEHLSLMVVPIQSHGRLRAMLVLENRLGRGAFTPDRLDAVVLIAGQLAVSLDNAMLYHSLEAKVASRTEALQAAKEQLELLSVTDQLTSVANRRRFDVTWRSEWELAKTNHRSIAVLMIDIDHFKQYNDTMGHLAGDECIQAVAKALAGSVRATDVVCRYGGEEFAIILPGTAPDQAFGAAQRARAAVRALEIPHPGEIGRVTVSIGVAAQVPDEDLDSQDLIAAADAALYSAKHTGRDRVVATSPDPGSAVAGSAVEGARDGAGRFVDGAPA
jgi:diguanylate cyclase (GGDEF)-like protein